MSNLTDMAGVSGFGTILLFIVGGIGFVILMLLTGRILRPSNPTEDKLKTYESGEEPVGPAWVKFNVRFYIIALIFLLFEAELVFLFPWAIVFGDESLMAETDGLWGWFSLVEILIFVSILAVGLAYAWKRRMLDWVKPRPQVPEYKSKIPLSVYQKFNERYTRK